MNPPMFPRRGFTPTPFAPSSGFCEQAKGGVRCTTTEEQGMKESFDGRTKAKARKVSGFTLIEMVVYIALLAVLTVLAVSMTLSMTRAFADLRVSRDINSSATALFERITRDIRGAYDVDAAGSVLGTNPGDLLLDTKDSGGANMTIEYFVSSGAVHIKENGIDQGPITSASTQAVSFIVREVTGMNSKAVKVEATLSATRGNITKQRNFYTTVVLRGTY